MWLHAISASSFTLGSCSTTCPSPTSIGCSSSPWSAPHRNCQSPSASCATSRIGDSARPTWPHTNTARFRGTTNRSSALTPPSSHGSRPGSVVEPQAARGGDGVVAVRVDGGGGDVALAGADADGEGEVVAVTGTGGGDVGGDVAARDHEGAIAGEPEQRDVGDAGGGGRVGGEGEDAITVGGDGELAGGEGDR